MIDVPAERRRAALPDVRQHPPLLARQRVLGLELCSVLTYDLPDVEARSPGLCRAPAHRRTRPRDGNRSSGLGAFCTSAVETRV